MDNKLIILLALDAMLLEIDDEYEGVPEEQCQFIKSKVLEGYGLTVTSSKADIQEMKVSMIRDIKKYRDQLIEEIENSI